jgi:hypothetical protein
MASDGTVETDRAHVQTYVPEYQKDEWVSEAEAMNMSLSEFVRSMVQAGRSDISADADVGSSDSAGEPAGTPSSTPDPGGSGLEDRVVDILDSDEFYDWDELVADTSELVEDAFSNLDAT